MRRLPVYFLLDVSESMIGENIKNLEDGLNSLIRTLRQDPHALETVYISIIAFAGKVQTIVPLIDVASFYPPKLPIGGGTSLGAALTHLMKELDRNIIKTTPEQKGDWKPIVYLLTDGKPTDSVNGPITRWKSEYAGKATLVAIALGNHADLNILRQISEQTILFENSTKEDFYKFIKWVTASVVTQSKKINEDGNSNLTKIDESIMSLIKDIKDLKPTDPDFVIITGRCQKTRLPYLMKYERAPGRLRLNDFSVDTTQYLSAGCYPVGEDYFDWSEEGSSQLKINTNELIGAPGCPHCGNISAFAMCRCGGILCVNGPGHAICPWCNRDIIFSNGGGDDEGFNVTRSLG